jgi:hypothetical protein
MIPCTSSSIGGGIRVGVGPGGVGGSPDIGFRPFIEPPQHVEHLEQRLDRESG